MEHNPVVSRRLVVVGLALLSLLAAGGCMQAQDAKSPTTQPIASGPFQASWDSLSQYQCPDWFRDAKFGIWAHWSAQCQPEQGDWYAQRMYQPNHADYKYHVANYGHPSKVGFKDICNMWKAEKWEPEKLIALYKRAGAKYFVALANHHCNFDCWDSKYQPWNSVNIGPKKDIVGLWAQAARKEGLRFGVTVHCARAWTWYEASQGSDKVGQYKDVPYDGKLTKADGKGAWWEGYDPQDLYAQNHGPGEKPDQAYIDKFHNRVRDLVDRYRPDLLYFDDGVMPLRSVSDAGLQIAAHYYNSSMKWHDGRNEAVMNTKGLDPNQRRCLVWDIERGRSDVLEPYPWQTDTCIGSWHYNRGTFERHTYKTPREVITTLVDIVSKNGNLLLNIPVKGDGTIDDDEVKILEELAKWMPVNGEGIFGTRPWTIFGECPPELSGKARAYVAEDLRFTTKGEAIYVFAMDSPADKVLVRSMGKGSPLVQGDVSDVRLLGHEGKCEWSRADDGLTIKVPASKPCEYVVAFKVTGLKTVSPPPADASKLPWVPKPAPRPPKITGKPKTVSQAADGSLELTADLAQTSGRARLESRGGRPNIGFWDDPKDWAAWTVKFAKAGTYEVSILVAAGKGESQFVVEVGKEAVTGKAPKTDSWETYQTVSVGKVEVKEPGEVTVKVRANDASTWKAINLASVILKPVK